MTRMNQFRSEGADKYPTTKAVTLRNINAFHSVVLDKIYLRKTVKHN